MLFVSHAKEMKMSIDTIGSNSVNVQQVAASSVKPIATAPVEQKAQAEKVLPAANTNVSTSQTELDKSIEQIQVMMEIGRASCRERV